MSGSVSTDALPPQSGRNALLTAAPPAVFGLGIAVGALVMGGPYHSIPTWRLVLGIALTALPWVVIVAGGIVAAVRRLPLSWGYTWAGAAVMMTVLAAQTIGEELAERGTFVLSPVAESILGVALILANVALLIVAAVRGKALAGLVSVAQAAIMGISLCQAATYAPFNRLDIALLAVPVGLVMGVLIHLYRQGPGRVRAGVVAALWLTNAGLLWLLNSVWTDWLQRQDKASPAVPLLFLLTALLLAGPILGILVSLGRRWRPLAAALLLLAPALCGISLGAYSGAQLEALQGQAIYASPEEDAQALVATLYSGVERVDLIHAGQSIVPDLWFVELHVWAASRSDGRGLASRDHDNPGWFFLRVPDGWVFIPEDRHPELVSLGKWLLDLVG